MEVFRFILQNAFAFIILFSFGVHPILSLFLIFIFWVGLYIVFEIRVKTNTNNLQIRNGISHEIYAGEDNERINSYVQRAGIVGTRWREIVKNLPPEKQCDYILKLESTFRGAGDIQRLNTMPVLYIEPHIHYNNLVKHLNLSVDYNTFLKDYYFHYKKMYEQVLLDIILKKFPIESIS